MLILAKPANLSSQMHHFSDVLVLQKVLPLCIMWLLFLSQSSLHVTPLMFLQPALCACKVESHGVFPLLSCMSIAVKAFFSLCKCWNIENMMNVKLFSNALFYGIKRNPVIVFLSVDVNMFHEGWQSILLLIFRRKIWCT